MGSSEVGSRGLLERFFLNPPKGQKPMLSQNGLSRSLDESRSRGASNSRVCMPGSREKARMHQRAEGGVIPRMSHAFRRASGYHG